LVVQTGPANERDEKRLLPMLKSLPPIPGRHGRPRRKPKALQGDAGYGFPYIIRAVVTLGILCQLKPRGIEVPHGSRLGKTRYVVERTLSWFGNFRRLKLCYERNGKFFEGFHVLAACIIVVKRLPKGRRRF
jgi:hypothetical protein